MVLVKPSFRRILALATLRRTIGSRQILTDVTFTFLLRKSYGNNNNHNVTGSGTAKL